MARIKSISCDLETYSSVNLAKSGVYRYCESPDFEILLFGYSADGGPVKVVDFTAGEHLPNEVMSALTDPAVTKWAFNAQFERVCLSRYLGYPVGRYLDPSSWRCTMVWAATLGLPLSLEGVGAVLGLEKQKLKEGKDLIRYFCTPAKMRDGTMVRHLPTDAPEKWATFKAYNLRDVETEMAIQEKLRRFPVPESEWCNYLLDQQINDRGIMLDMTMVHQAIACDDQFKRTHMDMARSVTGLENPNSPAQLKAWLAEKGVEAESLSKSAVVQMLEEADGEVELALSLRQELAKSSVKKYTAMEAVVGSDDRARGLIQFYGANRTGRYCLTGDHEVLTPDGWVRLDEWNGGKIACWTPCGETVSFQTSSALSFPYEGLMYEYEDKRIAQISTPDHKMYVKRRYDSDWQADTVENMEHYRPSIPFTGYRQTVSGMEHSVLRVLIMVQADGHFTEDGSVILAFTKLRKVERCKTLLRAVDITYTYRAYPEPSRVRHQFKINSRHVPFWLRLFRNKTFDTWLFDESADVFFDELPNWDGYRSAKNSIQYCTCNRKNADIVQAFAHISGRAAQLKIKHRQAGHLNWSDVYIVDIWLTPKNCHEIKAKPQKSMFTGTVYCAETPSGYFLVRRKGRVWVTGNSGRLIQVQNLPQNHLPDLEQVRALIRDGQFDAVEMLYDSVPLVLSELIRTAFVPKPGCRFFVADFSAIEARVIAWLAGESWRMELFRQGGDIYCKSASQMFGVPVEKHGVNGHLRQKGKIAELACIAEGELVLTDSGLVPIEKVSKKMKLWDGEEWVTHDGVIFRGERKVITYEGLTATPDHLVWVEGEPKPIQFGVAAVCGAHLVQTGDGRQAIRLGEDHQLRKTLEQANESLLCADTVHGLRLNTVAKPEQFEKRKIQGMPALFSAEKNTEMAGQTAYCSKTTLRKSLRSRLPQLWCKRNPVRISKRDRSWIIPASEVWSSKASDGNRQNKYEWRLCAWKPALCGASNELCQSASKCTLGVLPRILAVLLHDGYSKTFPWAYQERNHSGCRNSGIRKAKELEDHQCTARLYDIRNAGKHHRFTVSGRLVHNCGYGGSVGALKAMGAMNYGLTEPELKPLVDAWRQSNPRICKFWWDVDSAVKTCIKERTATETHGIRFYYQSGMMFIVLPSGRKLTYVKPKMGPNKFGGESVTYEGVGQQKKWARLESYGPKFVENIVQATARDILAEAMLRLDAHGYKIVMHVHDEAVIEAPADTSLEDICEVMGQTPTWAKGLLLRADGYVCDFYKKD